MGEYKRALTCQVCLHCNKTVPVRKAGHHCARLCKIEVQSIYQSHQTSTEQQLLSMYNNARSNQMRSPLISPSVNNQCSAAQPMLGSFAYHSNKQPNDQHVNQTPNKPSIHHSIHPSTNQSIRVQFK
jgi:hypothetical protein